MDAAVRMVSWDFHNYNSGASSLAVPYATPHVFCGYHKSKAALREGSYRSLAAVANAFAREAQVDEMAALAGMDAVEFRLKNVEDARLREAIERGAERAGWGKRKMGVAINLEKDARLALFVEVDVVVKRIVVKRIVNVFDCGAVLNPLNLRNQMEAAIVQGLGGALFEAVEHDGKRIVNGRMSRYRVPRFVDVPAIETILVDRRNVKPAGAGESPITTIAPAVANAVAAVTGVRLRSLPLERELA